MGDSWYRAAARWPRDFTRELAAMDAARAVYEVGYESPSQFSREYWRLFGNPPARDIAA